VRRALVIALSLSLLGAFATQASATQLKIGVIDVEYVIVTSKAGNAAKDRLKRQFDRKQKELDDAQKKLLELKTQLENASEMMPDERKRALLREYQEGLMKLQEQYLQNQQDLAKMEMELMKPILANLEKVLNDFAEKEGYDIIMNRSQHGVLFSRSTHDITRQVLALLDRS